VWVAGAEVTVSPCLPLLPPPLLLLLLLLLLLAWNRVRKTSRCSLLGTLLPGHQTRQQQTRRRLPPPPQLRQPARRPRCRKAEILHLVPSTHQRRTAAAAAAVVVEVVGGGPSTMCWGNSAKVSRSRRRRRALSPSLERQRRRPRYPTKTARICAFRRLPWIVVVVGVALLCAPHWETLKLQQKGPLSSLTTPPTTLRLTATKMELRLFLSALQVRLLEMLRKGRGP